MRKLLLLIAAVSVVSFSHTFAQTYGNNVWNAATYAGDDLDGGIDCQSPGAVWGTLSDPNALDYSVGTDNPCNIALGTDSYGTDNWSSSFRMSRDYTGANAGWYDISYTSNDGIRISTTAGASWNIVDLWQLTPQGPGTVTNVPLNAAATQVRVDHRDGSDNGTGSDDAGMSVSFICLNPVSGIASIAPVGVCPGTPSTITLTGYAGFIQWQSSITGPTSGFADIAGFTNPVENVTPLVETWYQAVVSSCGLTATSNVVSVEDNTNPTALCKDITVQLDASGVATITGTDIDNGSNDACGIQFLVPDQNTFLCSDVGANTVTLFVTDNHDNTSTCTSNVTVQDNVDPVVLCDDITVQLNGAGTASITTGDIDDGSSDACGIASLSLDVSSFTCTEVGSNAVVLTVTDNNTNSSTCTVNVEVEDNVDPVALCQDITVQLNAGGNGTADPNDVDNGSNDACGIASVSLDISSFTCTEFGSNTVELTVTDNNTNTATCTANVEVEDNINPVALCQDITVQLDAMGDATADPNNVDNGSNDACGIASLSLSTTAFTCNEIGSNAVTLTVTDNNSNVNTCTANVEVEDNIAPAITCPADITANIDPGNCSAVVAYADVTATDNCTSGSTPIVVPPVPILALGNGNDGEGMAFNPNDGLIYHFSGITDGQEYFEQIDPVLLTVGPNLEPGNTYGPYPSAEMTGIVWYPPLNAFVAMNRSFDIMSITAGGVVSFLSSYAGANYLRGFAVVGTSIYGVNPFSSELVEFNHLTGAVISSIPLTAGGPSVTATALTTDPVSGNVYCIYKNGPSRDLGIVAVGTGVITPLGSTGVNLAALTFDAGGQLFGLSGDGGSPSETLFTFNGPATGPMIMQTAGLASGGTFPVGPTTNTFEADDGNGNTTTCSFTVTVIDNIPPVALCQDVTVQLDGSGNGSTTANDVDNGSNDECGILSPTLDITAFTCVDVGSNTVVLTVTDNNSNVSTCTANVEVQDTLPPSITCPADIVIDNDFAVCGAIVVYTLPTATDNCPGATVSTSNPSGTFFPVGTTTVTIIATDASGNMDTCMFDITINDTELPILANCPADITISAELDVCEATVNWLPPTISDNCPGVSTSTTHLPPSVFPVGTTTVTYIATDVSGNIDSCQFDIIVEDGQKPVALCHDTTLYVNAVGTVTVTAEELDAGSTDNCAVDTVTLSQTDFSCTDLGDNSITFTAIDSAGNDSTCLTTITVLDTISPMAVCMDITVDLDASGNVSITGSDVDGGSTDNCSVDTLVVAPFEFNCDEIGDTLVTLTVTDSSGNSSMCTATVTVEDNVPPVTICQDVTIYLDDLGDVTLDAADVDNGSNDACGIDTITVDPSTFTCAEEGSNTVTLTVTDVNGNSATCTATATVVDTIPPVAICQDITVYLDDAGAVSIGGTDVDNGSNDACGIDTLTVDPSSFDCEMTGPNAVTLTAIDVNGNSATCTASVEVLDTIPPVITCPADIVVSNDPGVCEALVNVPQPMVTDNCGDSLSLISLMSGSAPGTLISDLNVPFGWTLDSIDVTGAPDSAVIYKVTLDVDISHTWIGDVEIALINSYDVGFNLMMSRPGSPGFGCSDDNALVTFDDDAATTAAMLEAVCNGDDPWFTGSAQPIAPMSASFGGDTINGKWYIIITDYAGGDDGTLNSWALNFSYVDPNGRVGVYTVSNDMKDEIASVDLSARASGSLEEKLAAADNTANQRGIVTLVNDYNNTDDATDVYPVGTTVVTWVATDPSGNTDTCTHTITVNDTEPPVVICEDITVYLDDAGNASIVAEDVSADIMGTTADGSINILTDDFPDETGFTLTSSGGNVVASVAAGDLLLANNPYVFPFTIDCDSQYVFEITDAFGDGICCGFGSGDYSVDLGGTIVASGAAFGFSESSNIACGASDNCMLDSISIDISSFSCADVGDNSVTLTAVDIYGNSASCVATVTVEDTIPPVAECQDVTVYLDNAGMASITPSDVVPPSLSTIITLNLTTDDFGVETSFALTDGAGDTLVYEITGNLASNTDYSWDLAANCTDTYTFLIEDSFGDGICCGFGSGFYNILEGSDTLVNGDNFTGASEVSMFTPASCLAGSDNCAVVDHAVDPSTFGCGDLGDNTVTVTVTDPSGNTGTCEANVTVMDTIPPVITCPADIVQANDSSVCEATVVVPQPTATDNCDSLAGGSLTFINDFNNTDDASGVYPAGTTTVEWIVTDEGGNSDTCTMTVTVNDTEPPFMVCQDITVQLDPTGNVSIVADDVDGGTTDNCEIDSLSIDVSSFTCADTGANTVVLTAVDTSGNSATCNAIVTVEDNVDPVALCQDVTVFLDGSGNVTVDAADVDNGSNDACGIDTLTVDPSMLGCAELGSNTVTLTATDVNGNSATCTANVEVMDTIPPVITCPADIVQDNDPGVCEAAVTVPQPTATDNCDAAAGGLLTFINDFNNTDDASGVYPVGTTTVEWIVTDEAGNSDTCSMTVTVNDTEPPVVSCNDVTIFVDEDGNATVAIEDLIGTVGPATVIDIDILTDDFPTETSFVLEDGLGNTLLSGGPFLPGDANTLLSFSTTNCGNNYVFTIFDAFGDGICCGFGSGSYSVEADGIVVASGGMFGASESTGFTANCLDITDNCGVAGHSIDQSDFSCADVGDNTVTVTVTDVHGNMATCTSTVTVEDDIDPEVACQDVTVYLDASGSASIVAEDVIATTGYSSIDIDILTDDFPGETSFELRDPMGTLILSDGPYAAANTLFSYSIMAECSGDYSFVIFDAFGDGLCCGFGAGSYSVSTGGVLVGSGAVFGFSDTVTSALMNCVDSLDLSDNCGVASWSADPTSFGCEDLGDNTVTVTVTDVNGNTGTCEATVTVMDTIPPVITCPADIVQGNDPGVCEATVTVPQPTATDNCDDANGGVLTYVNDYNNTGDASDVYPAGTTVVEWIVTDEGGNSDTCTMTIRVNDTEPPMMVCQDITVELDSNGMVSITADDIDGGTTDNCELDSISIDPADEDYDCSLVGPNTVTLTGVDTAGNTATCDATVTVEDNIAPEVACQDVTIYLDDDGDASIVVEDVIATLADSITIDIDILTDDFPGETSFSLTDGDGGLILSGGPFAVPNFLESFSTTIACTGSLTFTIFDAFGDGICCGFGSGSYNVDLDGNSVASGGAFGASEATTFSGGCLDFSDNCAVVDYSVDQTDFNCDETGDNTVTVSVTDPSGNIGTCEATVTVLDTIPPMITCGADTTVENDPGVCEAFVNVEPPLVEDNCGPVDSTGMAGAASAPGGAIPDGDLGNPLCDVINISGAGGVVVDVSVTVAVTHTWVGDLTMTLESPDGSVISLIERPGLAVPTGCCGCGDNNFDITFEDDAAVDSSTLEATCSFADATPWFNGTAQPLTLFASIAGESVDGDWTLCIGDGAGLDVGTLDSWSITVTGEAGARISQFTSEHNLENERRIPIDYMAYASRSEEDKQLGQSQSSTLRRGIITLVNDYNNTDDASDVYPVGTTVVTWTATDESGNSSTCTQSITVIDTEAPDPGCPADIDILANVWECSAVVEWEFNPTDNCSVDTVFANFESGDVFPLGTTTVSATAIDSSGNVGFCSFDITVSSDLEIIVDSVFDVSCFEGSDGEIYVTIVGGVPPYTVRWSNDLHEEDIDGLEPGGYVLFVEDAIGCTAITPIIIIDEPTPITEDPAIISDATCNGEGGGSIDVTFAGGTPPYTYVWSNGETTEDVSGLGAGLYQVVVTDANGCEFLSAQYLIDEPSAIAIISAIATDAECEDEASGSIDITVVGGTPPYTFLWDDGSTDEDLADATAGVHSVTITDANGCVLVSDDINVGEPDPIAISSQIVEDATCNGADDGSIDIFVIGGNPPYTYLWSDGQTTQDADNLEAGDYTVTITDANDCESTSAPITVGEATVIEVTSVTITDTDCNGASTGSIDIEVAGGTPPYMYLWSNGSTDQDLSGVPAGDYTGTITDANGCVLVSPELTVGEPTPVDIISAIIVDNLCSGGMAGSIDIEAAGGTPGYTYLWSNGEVTEDINGLETGDYSVVVTDDNGCVFESELYTVGETGGIEEESVVVVDPSCSDTMDASIDITIVGGTPPYTIVWSNGDTTEDLTGIGPGDYTYTVTDVNGCFFESEVAISLVNPSDLDVSITVKDASCANENSGIIALQVSGGTPPYTFLWSNGATTEDLLGIPAGIYDVTITDANGCTFKSGEIEVLQPDTDLTGTITATNESSLGAQDGSVDVEVTGGDQPYTFIWNTGDSTEDVSNLHAGDYCVRVIDFNGCEIRLCAEIGIGTGITDLFDSDLVLYPNPTSNIANLDVIFTRPVDMVIDLVDVLGRVLETRNYLSTVEQQITFDMRDTAAGTYFIRLNVDGEVHTLRLIVQH